MWISSAFMLFSPAFLTFISFSCHHKSFMQPYRYTNNPALLYMRKYVCVSLCMRCSTDIGMQQAKLRFYMGLSREHAYPETLVKFIHSSLSRHFLNTRSTHDTMYKMLSSTLVLAYNSAQVFFFPEFAGESWPRQTRRPGRRQQWRWLASFL